MQFRILLFEYHRKWQGRLVGEPDEEKYALKRMFAHQAGHDVDFTDEQAATVSIFKIVSTEYTGKRKPKM